MKPKICVPQRKFNERCYTVRWDHALRVAERLAYIQLFLLTMSHEIAPSSPAMSGHDDHGGHPINSFAIFIALCVCTALSVAFDALPLTKGMIAVLVLAVAVAKAQFVMRYFMHLKFEGRWKYILLLPTAILACGVPLALSPDMAMHYYHRELADRPDGQEDVEPSGEHTPVEHHPQTHP